jgi:hypothetical protein
MFHVCQLFLRAVGLPTNVGKADSLEVAEELPELVAPDTPESMLTPVPVNTTIFWASRTNFIAS